VVEDVKCFFEQRKLKHEGVKDKELTEKRGFIIGEKRILSQSHKAAKTQRSKVVRKEGRSDVLVVFLRS